MVTIKADMKSTYEHAIMYYKLGFSIIPIQYRSKVPALRNWKQYQTRRAERELIERWFQVEAINIGIVTGKISGIVVVDVDRDDVLNELIARMPVTWICKTSRGYHFYFSVDTEVRTKKLDFIGIDIKGEGGYVLAPPSIHPEGVSYRWISFIETVDRPADFSEFQKLLAEIIKERDSTKSTREDVFDFYDSEAGEGIAELYRGVTEGKRNVSLTRIAGSLYLDGLTDEEVKSVLDVVNSRNIPPLPEREVRAIIKSIGSRMRKFRKEKESAILALLEEVMKQSSKELSASEFINMVLRIAGIDPDKGLKRKDDIIAVILAFRAVSKGLINHLSSKEHRD